MKFADNILIQIFSFLLDKKNSRSKENKLTLSKILLTCRQWNKVGSLDVFWYPIAKELSPNKLIINPYLYVKTLSKNVFYSKPLTLDNWYSKYTMTVEVWDSITGISYFWCEGPIGVETLTNCTQTRLGILNDPRTNFIKHPFLENIIWNQNISSRITLSKKDQIAILSNSINKHKTISNREVGGYFNLPLNTKFISEERTSFLLDNMKGYLCFDIIPSKNNLFEIHTNTSSKYVSSLCYLMCNKEKDVANFISDRLTWI